MPVTTDSSDKRILEILKNGQQKAYLVLPLEERLKGFKRQMKLSYVHSGSASPGCNTITTMNKEVAETFARQPDFYETTYCSGCRKHLKVKEFVWLNTFIPVGT